MKNIIVITGAGKGIGRAIALDFAKAAGKQNSFDPILILISRTASDLEAVAAECCANGVTVDIFPIDIADKSQTDRLVDATFNRHGNIDCLVNNAGVGRFKPLDELTEKDFDYTISTNLRGTFFITQKVFSAMAKRKSGHIFFVTSIAAKTTFKNSAIYSMSKFGQRGLVETLRLYAKECNVRITNVMPGAVYTPMWGDIPKSMKSVMMIPEDISASVVNAYFLPQRTSMEEIVFRPVCGDINE
ncbi:MAG: SDR family oxidoreductase [Chlorobiaceae bacterium]